ncbi:MAG: hypothetical protein ABIB11_06030 [Candidatus Omnitrophota bacterium]
MIAGLSGLLTYGDGRLILNNVLPPNDTDMSIDTGVVTLDIGVMRKDEKVRLKTAVMPRNL